MTIQTLDMKINCGKIILSLLCLVILISGCQRNNIYYIKLENTYGLKKTDPVLIHGKEVGKVSAVDLRGNDIIVTITLGNKFNIYKNTRFTVTNISILGNKAIDITYPKENIALINSKDTLPGTYNDNNPVNRLMNKTDTLINNMADPANKKVTETRRSVATP